MPTIDHRAERDGKLPAPQLHLTQSAVSKHLKALEDELGNMLFERMTSGMAVTSAGRRLLPLAVQTLDAATHLLAAARALRGEVCGELHIGTIIDPESIRLGPLLSALLTHYPKIDVRLEHGISGTVLERLGAGALDACFYLGSVDDAELHVTSLAMERYVVAVPAAWAEKVRDATWREVAQLPWVGTAPGSSQTALLRKLFAGHGLVHHIVVQADQEASMIDMVRSGIALCLMRERVAKEAIQDGDVVVWRGVSIPCPLSMLMPRSSVDTPLGGALLDCVQRVWAAANDPFAQAKGPVLLQAM
jgi:DNA-binding transcriptional LysR family regulator